jgi:uncharacterized protein (DUF983 family)
MDTNSDKCNVCGSDYDEACGGVKGYFGILPVTFCEWCLASMVDMVRQFTGENDED